MNISTFDSEGFCGYTQKTTFWQDFSIADAFGISAIKDTYKRAFKSWKTNTEYVTELVMVLNWKCWQWYEKGNKAYSELYGELFYEDYMENSSMRHRVGALTILRAKTLHTL